MANVPFTEEEIVNKLQIARATPLWIAVNSSKLFDTFPLYNPREEKPEDYINRIHVWYQGVRDHMKTLRLIR